MNTTNYNLYLEEGSTTHFLDWRKKMNGADDSNMVKIDTALGEKADSSVSIDKVLTATAWSGDEAPYTQVLDISGLTAEQNGSIAVAQQATPAQRETARRAILSVAAQGEASLTIVADGTMPDIDIPVCVILLG